MGEGQVFNNIKFTTDISLNNFKKKQFGFGFFFCLRLAERFEFNFFLNFSFFYFHQWVKLYDFLINLVPKHSFFKKRQLLNIYILDLIGSYKGWRHSKGLPTRGQRSWTNAQSVYKSNLSLRFFKINLAKRIYGGISLHEATVAYLAEQVNLMWKLQWEKEWVSAKHKRSYNLKKKSGVYKIDLYSMAKGQVGVTNSKKKGNANKKNANKNVFLLGFDPGFTKKLLKTSSVSNLFKTKQNTKIQVLTAKDALSTKKRIKKKVVAKVTAKKKKKSSNWD